MKKRMRAKLRKQRAPESLQRMVSIRAEDISDIDQRVAVSISSQTDGIRFMGVPQVLLHESNAIDISPLRDVGAVLMNHDPNQIVGRPENIRIDEASRRVRADIVFDKDERSQAAFAKVQSGSLRGASVGFKVTEWKFLDRGETWDSPGGQRFEGPADVGSKWKIFEFSLTPIAADSEVGVGRSTQGREPQTKEFQMEPKLMAALVKRGLDENATDDEAQEFALRMVNEPPKPEPKPEPKPKPEEDRAPATEQSVMLAHKAETRERERAASITELGNIWPQYREMISVMVREGHNLEQARGAILEQLNRDRPPQAPVSGGFEYGMEHKEKFRRAAADSLLLRCGRMRQDKEESPTSWRVRQEAARDIQGFSLFDLMRCSLRSNGLSDRGDREDLMTRAFSHSSSDFPAILKDAANKRLLEAYTEAPSTWRPLCRIGSATDFKTLNRPKFGDMGNLVLTPDLVPMSEGSTMDVNESFQIGTYTKRFGIGRQAIINDDLSAFDRIPTMHGNAAARTVTDTFYNLLISASGVGPTMAEDSKALFATDHTSGANYAVGAAVVPDVAGLGILKKLMRLQRGLVPSGETGPLLNIEGSILLVPAALETAAKQTVVSIGDPSKSNSITFNPFSGSMQVIVEPRLDGGTNGTTAFYVVANPNLSEGAEVAFLNGNDTPTMVTEVGNNVLGTQWGIYLDFGVKFIEHRSWARHKGAA